MTSGPPSSSRHDHVPATSSGLAAVISASLQQCEVLEAGRLFRAPARTLRPATSSSYRWDFGDGTTATEPTAEHAYQTPGTYTVKLTVTDRRSAADSATTTVTVTPVDTTPPSRSSPSPPASRTRSGVVFSKPVEQASAETVANYAIDRRASSLGLAGTGPGHRHTADLAAFQKGRPTV